LPVFDELSDIITESSNLITTTPHHLTVKDKNALVRRLVNVYLESSLSDVCHEVINYQKTVSNTSWCFFFYSSLNMKHLFNNLNSCLLDQKLPEFMTHAATYLLKLIDVINAPISPWFVSVRITLPKRTNSLNRLTYHIFNLELK
jgi:hypothetical protein